MFEEAVIPVLYPLLAVLIWAADTIVSKVVAGVMDLVAVSFCRQVLATVMLTPFYVGPSW